MARSEVGRTLEPGTRVRITQRIVGREDVWRAQLEGEVLSHRNEPTGSWYAHGKNDRYWLNRVRLRRDDGEVTTVALDQNSTVEVLEAKAT